MAAPAAHAQFKDNLGNGYNNGTSAIIGTWGNRQRMDPAFGGGIASGIRKEADAQEARGRQIIKSGRATTRFPMRAFPLDFYMTRYWDGDAATRRKNLAEYQAQSALWNQEIRARRAKTGDIGDAYALAAVMCYEAYTGKRATDAGYARLAREFGRAWRSGPYFQGSSVLSKQELYEKTMLSASYALYLRRQGKVATAKTRAKEWMDKWGTGETAGVVKVLAPRGR